MLKQRYIVSTSLFTRCVKITLNFSLGLSGATAATMTTQQHDSSDQRKPCLDALTNPDNENRRNPDYDLIRCKSRGFLTEPSSDVQRICKLCESYFRSSKEDVVLHYQHILKNVPVMVFRDLHYNIFSNLTEHTNQLGPFDCHIRDLVTEISINYLKIRLHHATKIKNLNSNHNIRNLSKRKIIFMNQ